jgi:hypothetical protein
LGLSITRRNFLSSLAIGSLAGSLAARSAYAFESAEGGASDDLLDEIERRACLYFYEQADPQTGLILDRAVPNLPYAPGACSIAATGFGLSALAIAASRQYFKRDLLRQRTRRLLEFLNNGVEQEHGFFYHFVNSASGKRIWKCEVSSVDTGWLLCGVLHAKAYWDDDQIRALATALLRRADWQWMLNGSLTLSHGWVPEKGFLPYRWDAYCELLAMYLLAMSSETYPIPASCWDGWKRPMTEFQGIFFIDANTPLFVHQYSHAWFDFRDRVDRYANYFANSQRATQAHRLYCIDLSSEYPWFGPNMWGITASDSRRGYTIWVSPNNPPDGTLVPCAAGGSLAILPQLSGAVLQNMYETYSDHAWCKYGFRDAFHPQAGWYNPDVIGINLGITLLMAENSRTSAVWDAVMSTPDAHRAMEAAGLRLIRS